MHSFQGLEGVIVDIRDNPGGEDEIAYEIANRFVEEERIGHYKRTKTGPGETDFSQLKPWRLKPHRKPFTKPVVLICNDASSSAADVFALAMKQLPHVTLIGDPTKGIFSDMLEKKLPLNEL